MLRRLPLIFALLVLAACAIVPGTGRRQFIIFSPAEEAQLGFEAWDQTLATAQIVKSGPQRAMVKQIGQRIADMADQLYPDSTASFQWQFELINEPGMVNAWALPGGKSAVYTGLLPVTQTENGLAVVMGHEVAHALARHGGERMSQQAALAGILDVGAVLAGPTEKGSDKELMLEALGMGSQVGMLAFSRSHESEADEIGLMLMAHAGYDPREAVRLWERMAAMGGDRPPEWLSTHPSEQTRIQRLKELMPSAMAIYNKSGG